MSRLLATALLAFPLVVGCAHGPARSLSSSSEPGRSRASVGLGAEGTAIAARARSCSSDADCGARQICEHAQCLDITPELAECSAFRVHFAYDKTDLQVEDRPKLQRVARCLQADRTLVLTIAGNADERGTDEYNMALGDRRATDVARYLADLGVSSAQLHTVSYGKESPLCVAHDEACWATNRRALLTPGGSR